MSLLIRPLSKPKPIEKKATKNHKIFWLISLVSVFLPGLIVARLVYLQLLEGHYYQARAEHSRTRVLPKPPVRGSLFDRKGRTLATSRLSHAVYLWPVVQKPAT